MTVPTEVSSVAYVGTGAVDTFPVPFVFLSDTSLVVKEYVSGVPITRTLGVDYSVSGSDVVFDTPPAFGNIVTIERTVPFTQGVSFRTEGAFDPATHEDSFDESVFRDQQLDRRVKLLESAGAPGSVVAGNGLSFASTTLSVGAGAGIQANADTVEVLYGTAGNIANVTRAAASAGVLATAARSDHKHDASTAAPAAGSVAIGNAAGAGSASTLALSDHVHPVTAPAAPANVTKAAASAGSSANFAREDHKHDATTAAAIDLTDATNAEGAAASFARSDHTHSHGARGGGTLHANATSSTAGFMSAADKTKLDAFTIGETILVGSISTVDGTVTTALQWTPTDETVETVVVTVAVIQSDGSTGGGGQLGAVVGRNDGTVRQIGTTQVDWAFQDDVAGTPSITLDVSAPNVRVRVTGVAATNLRWIVVARRTIAS